MSAWKVLPWPEVQRFWPWDNPENPPHGPTRPSTAEVLAVRNVREALLPLWTCPRETTVFPLPQTYDEVTMRLQTPGGACVVAVDRVDAGSVPDLTVGRTLPVLVPDSKEREARLTDGTRRYAARAWRARIGMLLPQFAAGLGVALLVAWGLLLIRRTARRRSPKAPATRSVPVRKEGLVPQR
jgi:hypothetical protein